jgi:hypothetical protein
LQAVEEISVMSLVTFLTRYIDALYLARQQQPFDDSKGKQKCGMQPVEHRRSMKICTGAKTWSPPGGHEIEINVDGAFF